MTRVLSVFVVLFLYLFAACSSDSGGPAADKGTAADEGVMDRGGAQTADAATGTGDGPARVPDRALAWPDMVQRQDSAKWPCSPGEEGMCDDNKHLFCENGLCTQCPPNYVDCDRRGDCECFGACDGPRCVTPK